MTEKSPHYQAPLRVTVVDAVNQLENCEDKGDELYHLVNNIYNSRREEPIRKNTIDSFRTKLNLWMEQTAQVITDTYSDEIYVRNFGRNAVDDDWFNLNPNRLKERMFNSRKDTIKFQHRWNDADSKGKKLLKKEIFKDIGPIKSHWEYEKGRMLRHLGDIAESKSEYLTSRIVYLKAFESRPELVALEFPIMSAAGQIENLLNREPFIWSDSPAGDRFELTWDKIKLGGLGLKDAFRDTDVKTLRTPRKLTFDLERRNLLLIPPAGKGILTDTFSGFGWDRKKHTEIWNRINQIKADYEEDFKRAFSKPVSAVIVEWGDPPPKYDKEDIKGSFENLGAYLVDLDYIIRRIPCIMISKDAISPAIISRESISEKEIEDTRRFKIEKDPNRIWLNGTQFNFRKDSKCYKAILELKKKAPNKESALTLISILEAAGSRSKSLSSIYRHDKEALKILFKKTERGLYYFNDDFLS